MAASRCRAALDGEGATWLARVFPGKVAELLAGLSRCCPPRPVPGSARARTRHQRAELSARATNCGRTARQQRPRVVVLLGRQSWVSASCRPGQVHGRHPRRVRRKRRRVRCVRRRPGRHQPTRSAGDDEARTARAGAALHLALRDHLGDASIACTNSSSRATTEIGSSAAPRAARTRSFTRPRRRLMTPSVRERIRWATCRARATSAARCSKVTLPLLVDLQWRQVVRGDMRHLLRGVARPAAGGRSPTPVLADPVLRPHRMPGAGHHDVERRQSCRSCASAKARP